MLGLEPRTSACGSKGSNAATSSWERGRPPTTAMLIERVVYFSQQICGSWAGMETRGWRLSVPPLSCFISWGRGWRPREAKTHPSSGWGLKQGPQAAMVNLEKVTAAERLPEQSPLSPLF